MLELTASTVICNQGAEQLQHF